MRFLLLAFFGSVLVASGAEKPNFVFFLVDDLGWADVGINGSKFHETPNIDALAESGMRFTNGYAAASICSPTRASIVTGRHPVRVDITDWIPGQDVDPEGGDRFLKVEDTNELALSEVTIAEVLKQSGYTTFFAGKWHLGDEGHWPEDQGFDINIGGHDRGSPPGGYYAPWKNPRLKSKEKGEYLTERLTDESVDFLESRDGEEPFLLYLSYYNVHTPIQPYEKRIDHYRKKAEEMFPGEAPPYLDEHGAATRPRQDDPEFASMVAAVDDSVGAVLDSLEEQNLADNTVVIFFSDNGGLSTRPKGPDGKVKAASTNNDPLRAGKGWLYEGGIREATIVRAPGVTEPNSVSDEPVVSMDFFPTMLDLAGLPLQPDLHADGESLVPILKGGEWSEPRTLYWHYPHYHGSGWKPGAAIRDGDWKLVELWEWDKVELYNLAEDIGEENNLADEMPEKVEKLQKKLEEWQDELGAQMPEPNPKWTKEG